MDNYTNPADLDIYSGAQKFHENIKHILVIDDDRDILDWFDSIKKPGAPYTFHLLDDELKVLEVIQETNPDMVFLDICLNSISGRKIGEIIEATSYFKIPIIYMSAKKNWNIGGPIADQYFLSKPLSKKIVQGKIHKFLRLPEK